MKILVTGAKGFMGRNFISWLKNENKHEIYQFDLGNTLEELEKWARKCDIVFHLAGVNRPKDAQDFKKGNFSFSQTLVNLLVKQRNFVPIVFTSSIQVANETEYGLTKRAAEEVIFNYGQKYDVLCYVFELPNAFGKWARPNYNSVVATFCYNLARNLPIEINRADLRLVYIDDIIQAFFSILEGQFQVGEDGYSYVTPVLETSVQEIADILQEFVNMRYSLRVPDDSQLLRKYLYATLISYFPSEALVSVLPIHSDARGTFMMFINDYNAGRMSSHVTYPGETKGNHWHSTLIERFCNVSGKILFRMRKVGENEVRKILLEGEHPQVLEVPPGVVHNFTNVGNTESVTLIWGSNLYNPDSLDTFYESVEPVANGAKR
ncbi:MAG: NAD-dependent epimerase/dehydratase family protein [Bifidobacteriaceae bacterium]|jgi:UDP-2-acetamido-2,6-beta-L-arabino-hexul-4-ose reductase|nr:NAD-dependent epimerase/dehydratase family protein [Bifidobacteriaceae bacterium]